MRILLSAYACEPAFGSEPEVGVRALLAAASRHEVCALTRTHSVPLVRDLLDEQLPDAKVELIGYDTPGAPRDIGARARPMQYLHYERWQREAARRALSLDRVHDFDLVHHVTYSPYWARAGVAALPKPVVLGPLGGGVECPLFLLPQLGPRGLAEEVVRSATRRLSARRPVVHGPLAQAACVLAQNAETLARLPSPERAVVLNTGSMIGCPTVPGPGGGQRSNEIVFASRLIPWKGGALALRALRHVGHDGPLVFCGSGPDRRRLSRLASKLGLDHRVQFVDRLPRDQMLLRLARCAVLLHPAVHEEGSIVLAEALALGTPLVALRRGGVIESMSYWPASPAKLVEPSDPETTARRLAAAIDGFLGDPPPIPTRPMPPAVDFEDRLLGVYDDVLRATAGPRAEVGSGVS